MPDPVPWKLELPPPRIEPTARWIRVRAGDTPEPLAALRGMWTFRWDAGLSWFEEASEVHVHARDPHKRVDAMPSDRHVRVEIDGVPQARPVSPWSR